MANKIIINLNDLSSIDKAIHDLEAYKRKVTLLSNKLTKRLGELGYKIAKIEFEESYNASDDNEIQVEIEQLTENGNAIARIKASGTQVLFIEFGTGISQESAPSREYELIETPMKAHGQYGKKLASNPTGWYYTGHRQDFNPLGTEPSVHRSGLMKTVGQSAQYPMYQAYTTIEENLQQIAKEVWSSD